MGLGKGFGCKRENKESENTTWYYSQRINETRTVIWNKRQGKKKEVLNDGQKEREQRKHREKLIRIKNWGAKEKGAW